MSFCLTSDVEKAKKPNDANKDAEDEEQALLQSDVHDLTEQEELNDRETMIEVEWIFEIFLKKGRTEQFNWK